MQPLQTVSRAIAVLRAFEGGTVQLTLSELTRKLGLEKITTLRLARTLVQEGLLVHDVGSRRYLLSAGCLALCRGLLGRDSLVDAGRSHLVRGRDITGETCGIMVREGWYRVVLDSVSSNQPVRYVLDIGDRRPIYTGAAGYCLMSGLDPQEWLALRTHVEAEAVEHKSAYADLKLIDERLRGLRERGWALGRGGWVAEAAGTAAPIKDASGKIIAAVTFALPITRATDPHMDLCGQTALATAHAISSDIAKFRM